MSGIKNSDKQCSQLNVHWAYTICLPWKTLYNTRVYSNIIQASFWSDSAIYIGSTGHDLYTNRETGALPLHYIISEHMEKTHIIISYYNLAARILMTYVLTVLILDHFICYCVEFRGYHSVRVDLTCQLARITVP